MRGNRSVSGFPVNLCSHLFCARSYTISRLLPFALVAIDSSPRHWTRIGDRSAWFRESTPDLLTLTTRSIGAPSAGLTRHRCPSRLPVDAPLEVRVRLLVVRHRKVHVRAVRRALEERTDRKHLILRAAILAN